MLEKKDKEFSWEWLVYADPDRKLQITDQTALSAKSGFNLRSAKPFSPFISMFSPINIFERLLSNGC